MTHTGNKKVTIWREKLLFNIYLDFDLFTLEFTLKAAHLNTVSVLNQILLPLLFTNLDLFVCLNSKFFAYRKVDACKCLEWWNENSRSSKVSRERWSPSNSLRVSERERVMNNTVVTRLIWNLILNSSSSDRF